MADGAYLPSETKGTWYQPSVLLSELQQLCKLQLSFTLFFDGTKNSRERDMPSLSHSNIARLYNASVTKTREGIFSLYYPGVGTPFEIIGEPTPHPDGASMGKMGEERIRFAMLQVANRVYRLLTRRDIVVEDKTHIPPSLADGWTPRHWALQIRNAHQRKRVIGEILIDVFGFSRGATAARSFLNQFIADFCDPDGTYYCGIPIKFRFVGLFDTVASVGYADSVPGPFEGHQDWGDQDLLVIPKQVKQCVHFVAGHEARASFPVDLVLGRDRKYPANCKEIVYPGMHSDVGGGYGPREQGRSLKQSELLSQIPLNEMYALARKGGVPLLSPQGLQDARVAPEFEISPELRSRFNAYMNFVRRDVHHRPVVEHLKVHRRLYLGWRRAVLPRADYARLPFMHHANAQDRVNLTQANDELRADIHQADLAWEENDEYQRLPERERLRTKFPDGVHLPYYHDWRYAPLFLPTAATDLFEYHVHDSRAGFLVTDLDEDGHRQAHERLKRRQSGALRDPSRVGLWPQQRQALADYEAGRRPMQTDERPGASFDGTTGATDFLAAFSGRRELFWSYLHPRQVFAYSRVK